MKKVIKILELASSLSDEEFQAVVDGIRNLSSARASQKAATFVPKQPVQFKGRKGYTIFGAVEKIGSKNVVVEESYRKGIFGPSKDETHKGLRWRVHPSYLESQPR